LAAANPELALYICRVDVTSLCRMGTELLGMGKSRDAQHVDVLNKETQQLSVESSSQPHRRFHSCLAVR
jgi:hypothetical protein